MDRYSQENSYRNIVKRISAFGGVQIFNVLVGLVRGKFVALFLGPEGMGINTLFTSSTNTIQQIAALGLNTAMVKEVAAVKEDPGRLGKTLKVAIRLIVLTSLLGALICAAGAPLWSSLTFGDYEHVWSYIVLGISVALSVGAAGYLALLQGLGSVKRLAFASLVGSVTGLLCGVPLYWLLGDRGIVPAIIILSLAMFLFYYISYRKEKKPEIEKSVESIKEQLPLVRHLVGLGLILMGGALAGTAVAYLINLVVRSLGSVEDVGLFQAANSLTNQYTGVIFSALAMDYFPRLSGIASDSGKLRETVNRQTEIVMLGAAPLVLLLIVSSPLVIRLLLSDAFLDVVPLMRWLGLGMLIQAIAFPIGYIYIARADRKAYVWLEIVMSNIVWLACSAGGYYLWGLIGLGVSLVVRGIIDLIVNLVVCKIRYGFVYSGLAGKVLIFSILIGATGFVASFSGTVIGEWIGIGLLIISSVYSFIELRKRLRRAG